MLAFASKRLGIALLVALTVSLITFSMIYVSGDPAIAIAGEGARAQDIEAIRKFYGFDRPIAVQYFDWLAGALTPSEAEDAGFSRDPAVRAAAIARLFTEPGQRIASGSTRLAP